MWSYNIAVGCIKQSKNLKQFRTSYDCLERGKKYELFKPVEGKIKMKRTDINNEKILQKNRKYWMILMWPDLPGKLQLKIVKFSSFLFIKMEEIWCKGIGNLVFGWNPRYGAAELRRAEFKRIWW